MHKAQSLINHVVIVLDASWSMKSRKQAVIKATDSQIKYLAQRSQELNQETRVSIYRFGGQTIECLIFDMDVARLPSTNDLYDVLYENTSLITATLKSQQDLATTSQIYGDHAFLTFVLTDGQENESHKHGHTPTDLKNQIVGMPNNWSMGWLVPDQSGVKYLESLGVLRDSIATWDATSTAGLDTAVSAIKTATDNFMTSRAKGVRGTRSVFSTGTDAVNKATVVSTLTPMAYSAYNIFAVKSDSRIDEFVRGVKGHYAQGNAYYQLTKTETIQPQKLVIVVDKTNGKAYSGAEARHLIGLPDGQSVRVRPDYNPKYDIFVQSTSVNRKLLQDTKVLVLA